jgi:hypothetical protein
MASKFQQLPEPSHTGQSPMDEEDDLVLKTDLELGAPQKSKSIVSLTIKILPPDNDT